jgi:hypothetical protein
MVTPPLWLVCLVETTPFDPCLALHSPSLPGVCIATSVLGGQTLTPISWPLQGKGDPNVSPLMPTTHSSLDSLPSLPVAPL